MWPFNRKQDEVVGAVAVQETPVAPVKPSKPEVICPKFGEQVGGLTRFGKTWLNLAEVSVIEFQPPDGCGCEVMFKNNDTDWHVSDEDALAIQTYLQQFEQFGKQIDS